MDRRVIFYDGMDNDPADYNNLQGFVQESMEDVVSDGITDDRKFAGFVATITGAAEVTIEPGRFFSGGKVYRRAAAEVKDFTTSLPVASKKIVLVSVWGTETETDARPREFLVNEETGASEPRVVALERARVANIGYASSSESPDPVDPILDTGVLAVCRVTLSPTGVSSVEMITANRLDSVSSVAGRATALEAFQAEARPQIVALGSDIAALKVGVTSNAGQADMSGLLTRLAVLEEKNGIPSDATASDADFFLDTEESDTLHASYLAQVDEGVRFADEAADTEALSIFNALNPAAKITGGVMFPAYNRALRMSVGPRQGEVQVSSYSYQTHEMVQKAMSRTRIRYGFKYTVSTAVLWWNANRGDYWARTFARLSESFPNYDPTYAVLAGYYKTRAPSYWYDTVEEHYWDKVTTDHAVPGAQVAETFLNANDMWLDAVGLTFTRLAATGGFTLAICEVNRGMPDLEKVVSFTTVDRSSMVLNAETVVPIQPTFLEGGKRYAMVVVTAADHWLATTAGENFPAGTFFYVLDGAYQQGDGTRDLCFSLYAAKFTQSRAVIDLNPLSLSGGISTLDINADTVVPDSTNLTFEVQIGSVWKPISGDATSVLSLNPLLPLRAVFTGTPDVMPALRLTDSTASVSRPRVTFTHISAARTVPSTTSIFVTARLESFDAAHHTCTCKIRTGGSYATVSAVPTPTDVVQPDGSIERTWHFTPTAVTAYKIQIEGTTDSALNTFHVAWRKDYVL